MAVLPIMSSVMVLVHYASCHHVPLLPLLTSVECFEKTLPAASSIANSEPSNGHPQWSSPCFAWPMCWIGNWYSVKPAKNPGTTLGVPEKVLPPERLLFELVSTCEASQSSFCTLKRRCELRRYIFIIQPNMYARGILFGKTQNELGRDATVRSPELGQKSRRCVLRLLRDWFCTL